MDWIAPVIYGTCERYNLSYEESCDVFGQVSYILLKNLRRLKSADKLLHFVGRITANEAVTLYRKTKLKGKAGRMAMDLIYDRGPEMPDEIFEYINRTNELMKAVTSLPKRQAEVIKTLFFENPGMDYRQVAEKLNMPVSSIGPTRLRGLANLYRILKQRRFEF
jgi:RNA polymerase sigma factor (sigma-70 family)